MLEGTSGDLAQSMTATPSQDRRTSTPLKSLLLAGLAWGNRPSSGVELHRILVKIHEQKLQCSIFGVCLLRGDQRTSSRSVVSLN